MKKTILFSIFMFTAILAFTLDYTIELVDSYGDGWNDGSLDVLADSTVVLNDITMTGGAGPDVFNFTVSMGDTITTEYTPGSWSYENEYQIKNEVGSVVAESGQGGVTPGNVFYQLSGP
jgi:hypothetical protein